MNIKRETMELTPGLSEEAGVMHGCLQINGCFPQLN